MRPLSAADAISPAFARAWRLLTQRRSWATALKLTFFAILAELGGGLNFNFSGRNTGAHPHLPHAFVLGIAAFTALIVAFFFLLGLVLFYIGSRVQFVIFDLLLRQDTQIAPSWRLFGPVTWRWIGIRLLVLLAVGILFSPLLVPVLIAFIHVVRSPAAATHPGVLFSMLFGYMGTILLVVFVYFLVFVLLRTFGLPAIVFENTGVGVTFRRTFHLFRADIGQSLLYLLFQVALRIGMVIAGYLALFLAALISAIPPAILGVILYFLTHGHGPAGKALLIAGCVLMGAIWLVWVFILSTYVFGGMQLFLNSYALYFAAGRYAPLGNILAAQEPQLAWPTGYPPPAPTPAPPLPPAA